MSASAYRPRLGRVFPEGWFGPLVTLVRTRIAGSETRELLPAALAVYEAESGVQNGRTVARARVRDGFGQSG